MILYLKKHSEERVYSLFRKILRNLFWTSKRFFTWKNNCEDGNDFRKNERWR